MLTGSSTSDDRIPPLSDAPCCTATHVVANSRIAAPTFVALDVLLLAPAGLSDFARRLAPVASLRLPHERPPTLPTYISFCALVI